MVTSTEDLRGSGPEVSSDTIGAAFMYNASDNGHIAQPKFRRLFDKVISNGDLDELLVAIKAYLEEATRAHSISNGQNSLLNERSYTWTASDSDVRGVLLYILEATDCSRHTKLEGALSSYPDFRLSDQCPRIFKTMHPVALGPATTISVPEASFISDGHAQKRRRSSTTATIFSRDNVTKITWQANLSRLAAAGDPQHSPVGSDISRLSPGTSSDETRRGSCNTRMSADTRSGAEPSSKPDVFNRDSRGTQQRSSMIVTTGANETAQQAVHEVEEADQKVSYMTRLRRKSVQLGQAIGSFMNGDYRNADHRPRRESTIVRLRRALDRIEPSRPKHDAAIFGSLTGARPVDAVDQYHARRLGPQGPPSSTCSEDGRLHRCVQHEVGTPPG